MKKSQESIDQRHEKIIELLKERKSVKAADLALAFDISLMTARRDLHALEKKGLVVRFHGGARIALEEDLSKSRQSDADAACNAISKYAASLVDQTDSIFINGSMTAVSMLDYVETSSLSIVTNNAHAANYSSDPRFEITLLGGTLKNHILVGDYTMRNLLVSFQNKAFMGCSGISDEGEILCDIPSELAINETMISHAVTCYILADSSKLGKTGFSGRFALMHQTTVITDSNAPADLIEKLKSRGMKVIAVDVGKSV